jgi:patatin-related protein
VSERELRLAVLSHGSFAHAYYSLGASVQLHKMVRASESVGERNGDLSPSERVFDDLLSYLEGVHDVRTRIVVDAISGASAGGINAVFLAKALAVGGSLEPPRDLWISRGSAGELLPGPVWLPAKLRIQMAAAGAVGRKRPVLRTERFARWTFQALQAIDESRLRQEAVRDGGDRPLDLLLTLTDLHGIPETSRVDGQKALQNRRHRFVVSFARHPPDVDEFGPAHNAALAFAAQATSALPGFFRPANLEHFTSLMAPSEGDVVSATTRLFRRYDLSAASPNDACFVDGGVAASTPLGTLLAVVSSRTPSVETDRRLLLIEPNTTIGARPVRGGCDPGWLRTLWEGLAEIPSREAITNDLARVADANAQARRVREIIETHWASVEALVERVCGQDVGQLDLTRLAELRNALENQARSAVGYGYRSYGLAKVHSAVEFAAELCANLCDYPAESNEAVFVRETLTAWAEQRGLLGSADSHAQVDFLRAFDVPHVLRRLQFVAAGVNYRYRQIGLPGAPPREDLDRVKALLADVRDRVATLSSLVDFRASSAGALDVFRHDAIAAALARFADGRTDGFLTPAADYASDHADELNRLMGELQASLVASLSGHLADLTLAVSDAIAGWSPDERSTVLVRLLGWPFWDALLFPVLGGTGISESSVLVERISPQDAVLLADERQKAYRGKTGDVLAFFDRGRRENDYLWGRLDTAEVLVAILLDRWHPDFPKWTLRVVGAILEEEEASLPTVQPIIQELRATEQPLLRLQQTAARTLGELRAVAEESAPPDQELPQEIQRELREAARHIVAEGRDADADAEEGTERYLAAIAAVQKESPEEPPKSLLRKARDRVCPLYPFC